MAEPDFTDLLDDLPEVERASRLALLERLHAAGCTREELLAAHSAGRLSQLPSSACSPSDGATAWPKRPAPPG